MLASSNAGKLREFRELLAPLEIEVVPQAELGVPDAAEPHASFVETRRAIASCRATNAPVMLAVRVPPSACSTSQSR